MTTVLSQGFYRGSATTEVRYYVKSGTKGYYFKVDDVKEIVKVIKGGDPTCTPASVSNASFDWNDPANASHNIDLTSAAAVTDPVALQIFAQLYRQMNPFYQDTKVRGIQFSDAERQHKDESKKHERDPIYSLGASRATTSSLLIGKDVTLTASALVGAGIAKAFADTPCAGVSQQEMAQILLSLTVASERPAFAETRKPGSDLFSANGVSFDEVKKSAQRRIFRYKGAMVSVMDGQYGVFDLGSADPFFMTHGIDIRPVTECGFLIGEELPTEVALTDAIVLSDADFNKIKALGGATTGTRQAMCKLNQKDDANREAFLGRLIGRKDALGKIVAYEEGCQTCDIKSVRVGLTYHGAKADDMVMFVLYSKQPTNVTTFDVGDTVEFYMVPYSITYNHGRDNTIYNRVLQGMRQHGMEWNDSGKPLALHTNLEGWDQWGKPNLSARKQAYLMWAAANVLSGNHTSWKKEHEAASAGVHPMITAHLRPDFTKAVVNYGLSLERSDCMDGARKSGDEKTGFNDITRKCVPSKWWVEPLQKRFVYTTSKGNLQAEAIIPHEFEPSSGAKYTGILVKRGDCKNIMNPQLMTEFEVDEDYFNYMKESMNIVTSRELGILLCGVEIEPIAHVSSGGSATVSVTAPSSDFGPKSALAGLVSSTTSSSTPVPTPVPTSSTPDGPLEQQKSRNELTEGMSASGNTINANASDSFKQGMQNYNSKMSEPEMDAFTLAVGTKTKCESDPAFIWEDGACFAKTEEDCPIGVSTFLPGLAAKFNATEQRCVTDVMFGVNPDFVGAAMVLSGAALMFMGKK